MMDFLKSIHSNYSKIISENVFAAKSMFYLLTPRETYFESIDDVPPLVDQASNLFFGFIVIEFFILTIFGKKGKRPRVNDGVASLSAGLFNRIPILFVRSAQFSAYVWLYDNYRLGELPWNHWLTYLITLLLVDFGYYVIHRSAHEVNILWAAHQVHHSSEDYNLTTALRQPVLQDFAVWVIYLPLAFFIPPSIFAVHSHMNLLYQFWIHNRIVETLGPLDYIFNSARHHKIHHGRNGYCIDKNYGGVLIIWDRMFGTFESGDGKEEIAYGLVHNIHTFNPLYIQYFQYKHIWNQFWKMESFSDKLSVLFKGPGWQPGTPRLGDDNFPAIEYPIQKYNPQVSNYLNAYILFHFLMLLHIFSQFLFLCDNLSTVYLSFFVIIIIYSLTSFGAILDAKLSYAYIIEALRALFWILLDKYTTDSTVFHDSIFFSSDHLYNLFKYSNILSFSLFSFLAIHRLLTPAKQKSN